MTTKRKTKRLPSNWRDRTEFEVEVSKDGLQICLLFKKGFTPKGFYRYIGMIVIGTSKGAYYVEEFDVEHYFNKYDIGKEIFIKALKHCKEIITNYHCEGHKYKEMIRSMLDSHLHYLDFLNDEITILFD